MFGLRRVPPLAGLFLITQPIKYQKMTRLIVVLIFTMFIAVCLSIFIFIKINPHSNENSINNAAEKVESEFSVK